MYSRKVDLALSPPETVTTQGKVDSSETGEFPENSTAIQSVCTPAHVRKLGKELSAARKTHHNLLWQGVAQTTFGRKHWALHLWTSACRTSAFLPSYGPT